MIFSLAQVAERGTQQDIWIAIHGKVVYNLTGFASDHPGGINVLQDCSGTDATETYDYAGHSADAINSLQPFQVGVLEGHPGAADSSSEPNEHGPISEIVPKANGGVRSREARIFSVSDSFGVRACSLAMLFLVPAIVVVRRGTPNGAAARLYDQTVETGLTQHISNVWAFVGGFFLTLACSYFILAAFYVQFSRTLKHTREVFEYPSVIAVRRGECSPSKAS
ncbi:cytochrome b5 [Corynespora cassiicola Philippines]|uniref:Cytochrome b5 n=1 Tax=Corynespora cassiicola Philippines TaxID=1448308 RepID=A0A2T2N1P6_CORCC|nr:cytochrome b5 [Corynespora cassiicola Philippines]